MIVDKRKLILNDYYRNNCLVKRIDIFGDSYPDENNFKMEPYQPNFTSMVCSPMEQQVLWLY